MSRHRHISKELILAARRGQISHEHLVERLLARLAELCPICREEALATAEEEIPETAYAEPVAHALDVEEELARFERDSETAPELLRILQGLSPQQRLLRIRNAPERFANLALGEFLLDEARACLPDDPHGSLAWARVAQAVADIYSIPHPPHQVLAVAYQGNAYRATGDFDRAQRFLYLARDLSVQTMTSDIDVGAQLHSFLGSLFSDLSRFDEAEEQLRSAAGLYELLADDLGRARVLIKLGAVLALRGDLPAALQADNTAVALLSPHDDEQRECYLGARLNYAIHALDAGDPVKARDLIDLELFEFEQCGPYLRVRFDGLQARIAAAFGNLEEAEAGYRAVLKELDRQQKGFLAAHYCLELGALYLEQGRYHDLQTIAARAVQLFQAHETHREALAALVLFRKAAEARHLTAEALQRIRRFLETAQRDPGARFQLQN
ncbi:MAG: tetratricopeptide repeat protein [Gemmatimonadota bacterium]